MEYIKNGLLTIGFATIVVFLIICINNIVKFVKDIKYLKNIYRKIERKIEIMEVDLGMAVNGLNYDRKKIQELLDKHIKQK